jgi:hypothetical protein
MAKKKKTGTASASRKRLGGIVSRAKSVKVGFVPGGVTISGTRNLGPKPRLQILEARMKTVDKDASRPAFDRAHEKFLLREGIRRAKADLRVAQAQRKSRRKR